MIGFDYPWMAFAAPGIGLLAAGLILLGFARRRTRLARYGTPEAVARLAPADVARRPFGRALRLAVAAALIAVALGGPRWGESESVIESEGVDIAIALDVSLSMLAEDVRPSRLERMKQEVRRLRATSPGDRMALIAFAGRSYILSPLTSDDGAIELFLSNLGPEMVSRQGSALAPPLQQGLELLLASRGDADRALVVMTDGEAFDDHELAVQYAAAAKDAGVKVVTVAFGSPGGGTIPLPGTGGAEVKRDEDGEVVVSRPDEAHLEAIAAAGGGEHIPADATDKANRVRRALATLEAAARAERTQSNRPARYQLFAAIALLLLLWDALNADGVRLWWRRRRAVAALLLAACAAPAALGAQAGTLEDAIALHRAGRYVDAIRVYRNLVANGDARGVVLYDLGTSLLAADSLDAAIEALERASFTVAPALRRDARYNLGLAYLRRGLRGEGEARSNALQSARRAFRTVLLERPGDADAQWNYELAMRTPQGGGGGGRGNTPPPPQAQEPPPPGRMNRQQAEALLDASAREEREVQARRRPGEGRAPGTGVRDW